MSQLAHHCGYVFGVISDDMLLSGFVEELILAIATMILLFVLPYVKLSNRPLVGGISRSSDMSYSLNSFHFPFAAFCWFVFIAPSQFQPTIASYGRYFIFLGVNLTFFFIMRRCFERQTGYVRDFLNNELKASLIK